MYKLHAMLVSEDVPMQLVRTPDRPKYLRRDMLREAGSLYRLILQYVANGRGVVSSGTD